MTLNVIKNKRLELKLPQKPLRKIQKFLKPYKFYETIVRFLNTKFEFYSNGF